MAEWDDEQIEFIKEKVSEEGKQEDLLKGKDAAQVILSLAIVALLYFDSLLLSLIKIAIFDSNVV